MLGDRPREIVRGMSSHGPADVAMITLPTGDTVRLLPILPTDKQLLQAGLARLSSESRYRRFLCPHNELSPQELRYLTEVDHVDHEALVALDATTGEGVGVARYVRSSTEPAIAEFAVAVVDDWQGRGVGTALVVALAERARREGIGSFSALVLTDNERILNLLEDLGKPRVVTRDGGALELVVDLPPYGLGDVTNLLRAAARRNIAFRHPAARPDSVPASA
jgi:GNAT superfamily N-acetyltransferase